MIDRDKLDQPGGPRGGVMEQGLAADPLDRLRRLEINAKEWLAGLSLSQLVAVAEAFQDTLLERRSPAAALVSEATVMLRRQLEAKA